MWSLLTNKYVLGAIGIALIIVLALWYRGQVYEEGYLAGQSEVKLAVNKALEDERAISMGKADAIEASAKQSKERLQAEIRSLRAIKDPTACFITNLPTDMAKRLRDTYDSYNQ